MANQWFKFYGGEFLSDPKILQLSGEERSCWLTLLCLASQTDDGVIKFLSESQLLSLSGVTRGIPVLKKFEELAMIDLCNGNVTVKNWLKRQLSESTLRVRNFRMKQKGNGQETTEENRIERIEENIHVETSPKFEQVDLELSTLLRDLIFVNTPTFKPPNLERWASEVRLMRERDGRTREQIKYVIEWCQKDNFWKANILSTKKLREKFDQLVSQIKRQVDQKKIKSSNIAFT